MLASQEKIKNELGEARKEITRLSDYCDKLENRASIDQALLKNEIDHLKKIIKSNKRTLDDEDDNNQLKQANHRFNVKQKELIQAGEKIEKLNSAFKNYCTIVSKINECDKTTSDKTASEPSSVRTTNLTLDDLVAATKLPDSPYQTKKF